MATVMLSDMTTRLRYAPYPNVLVKQQTLLNTESSRLCPLLTAEGWRDSHFDAM